MTLFRFLIARYFGSESAYGHLAAAVVNACIEELAHVA